MNIKVEAVDEVIECLSLLVYENRLEILIPNKVTVHEVVFLVASLLNQESNQILKVKDSERFVTVGCGPIDTTKVDTVILKTEPQADFVNDEIVDMFVSKFSFESARVAALAEHSDFKLGATK